MAQENDNIVDLINRDLLDALFDEWMRTDFHTITANGRKVVCIDKDGTRTETADLKGDKGDKGEKGDKGDDLHWYEMSEAEKEDLSDKVLDALVFASVETCVSIIDELT